MARFSIRIWLLLLLGGMLVGAATVHVVADPDLRIGVGAKDGTSATAQRADAPRDGVVGPFEPSGTTLRDCESKERADPTGQRRCVEQSYGNLAFERGPKVALGQLARAMASDAKVRDNCHRVAHVVGAAAFAKYDGQVGEPLAQGSSACASGYYHGLLRGALDGVGTSKLVGTVSGMCDPKALSTPYLEVQCGHGLGHAVLLNTGFELPATLRACDSLGGEAQGACVGGAYMEIMSAEYNDSGSGAAAPTEPVDALAPDADAATIAAQPKESSARWLREDDLVYPCNAAENRHKQVCYAMVATRIYSAVGNDWALTGAECMDSERAWIGTCFQSIGRLASAVTSRNHARIAAICGSFEQRLQSDCIGAAASEFVWGSTKGEGGARLCDMARPTIQSRCYEDVGRVLATVVPDVTRHRAACAQLTSRHAASCASGFTSSATSGHR